MFASIWGTSHSPRQALVFNLDVEETVLWLRILIFNEIDTSWEIRRDVLSPGSPSKLSISRDIPTFGYLMSGNRQCRDSSGSNHGQPLFLYNQPQLVHGQLNCSLSSSFSTAAAEFSHSGKCSWVHHIPTLWPDCFFESYLLNTGYPLVYEPHFA